MRIKILGTRGEIKERRPRYTKQSGILIDGVLLLDLGEQSFLKYHPKWILLTHLHPDHAYFVRKGKEEIPKTTATLYGPEKKRRVPIELLKKKKRLGPFTITPIPTHHSKLVKSQAYLIKKGKKTILYTGDLVWINKEYHHLFRHVDLIITEASFFREGGMIRKDPETGKLFGHAGVPNLVRTFRKYTKKILFVHFGSWFYKNVKASRKKLCNLGKKNEIPVIVGYDGMKIDRV